MNIEMESSWKTVLAPEFEKGYFSELTKDIHEAYLQTTVFPPQNLIFNAFAHCPFTDVRVVILGQDPYHDHEQAMGLSFSVPDGVKVPPSLKNIYKEIQSDLSIDIPKSGNLERWTKQGVLLLNATLTVEAHKAGSHQGRGWEEFTDAVIAAISKEKEHVVFLLWGSYAQKKGADIDTTKHLVLTAPHPSPLSAYRGFFGCQHFSQTNKYLETRGLKGIDW